MRTLLIVVFSLTSLILFHPADVKAEDPVVSFTNAKNAFEAGAYEEAASRFRTLLDDSNVSDAMIVETHKYLGVCYIFLGDEKNAEDQFLKLLNLEPEFTLDPLVFPIDVVDFFTSVQRKHALRLEIFAEAKEKAEAEQRKADEKKRLEEIERLRTTVFYEKTVTQHSRLVSLMPFGAGQFQNGHKRKGIVFLSGELFFITASAVTYVLHEGLRDKASPFYSADTRKDYESLETGYRVANRISIGALSLMVFIGIVDSIYHFEPQTEKWRKVDEKDVPRELQKKNKKNTTAMITPYFDRHSAGLGAVGFF
ncbi:MAG: hypothetical protein JXR45_12210 [Deltaproteobacteria bacterium]|nr:hypothetical protein [Deltaproteobacteria bacterium]